MGRAHTGSNSTQEIGTRKRGSTISTGWSTMISLMSLSTVSSMDYRLDPAQKPICLMYFIGRTEPAFLKGEKNQFFLSLVVSSSLHAHQVGTGVTPLP